MATEPLLLVSDLQVSYGQAQVLDGVRLAVGSGEFVTVVGANGAGKTTLLRAIMGLVPARGRVQVHGQDILHWPPHRRAELGIGYVPEGRRVFPDLTVFENLQAGAYRLPGGRTAFQARLDFVYGLFPRLAQRRHQLAASLSGGEQQMLAVGRALMIDPVLLIIDEISMGLAPVVVDQLFRVFGDMHRQGVTILLVEQNAQKALAAADRGYVLETGRITMEGPAAVLRNNPAVVEAYLQSL